MAKMQTRECKNCGDEFQARTADVNRGWAKFCSKSCKATEQEKRTGQHTRFLRSRHVGRDTEPSYGRGGFTNAHQFSNEDHDCNKD